MNAFWLLFLLANGGWAAPGHHQQRQHHHLEIGVQGDMPTLVDALLVRTTRTSTTTTTEAAGATTEGLEVTEPGSRVRIRPTTTTEGISRERSSTPESSTDRSSTERITMPESASERITTPEIGTTESSPERSTTERSTTERSTTERSTTERSTTERSTTESSTTERSIFESSTPERTSITESSTPKISAPSTTLSPESSTESSTPEPPPATSNATTVSTKEKALPETDLPAMQLLDLEHTAAPPPLDSGHDGLKLTRKKQLQQQHFPASTPAPRSLETEMERIPTTARTTSTTTKAPHSHHSGYLGPIFMGEKTFSVVHPLKKPQPASRSHQHVASIESQLRNGQLVEILAPTALLEQLETSTAPPPVGTGQGQGSGLGASSVSTTVFQVPELQTSTSRLPTSSGERTESKISDIQIEVYDSTVDSIVASTNFRDSEGFYPPPAAPLELVTSKPESLEPRHLPQELPQERFTQYVIDRADVSTQPASGGGGNRGGVGSPLGQPEPAAIEIHINVSEAFGSESEDLEFSYRQPEKPSKLSDEILVVEIIDSGGDNSSQESGGGSSSSSDPVFTFRNSDAVPGSPPAVRPPQQSSVQDADELFMADLKDLKDGGGSVPRPPPPPPPPPLPRKPTIDRDSDTIFYISNTEVKVGESLPTAGPGGGDQQRKFQLENQFFPASYVMDQSGSSQQSSQRSSAATEEDIILSPHHSSDSLKIYRSDDGAPPLDVTYVGESVIEVEQQPALGWGSSSPPPPQQQQQQQPQQEQQQDIVIQPAVLPDLAIGVPVIGELPPQIELKEIDYMPGELGMGVYENDLQGNSIDSEPDVIESSIQYGGDLIDDGAGGGFDGVEGSYPFESPAHRQQQQQQQQQQQMGHGLSHLPGRHSASHLHREQLPVAEMVNATLLQRIDSGSGSGSGYGSGSGSGSGSASAMAPLLASGRSSNATALSEDPLAEYEGFFNLFAVSMGLIIVILPSALLVSMYCAIKYVLNKNSMAGAGGAPGDDSEQGQDSSKHESDPSASASSSSSFTSSSGAAFASASATTTTTTNTSCPRRQPPEPLHPQAAPLGAGGGGGGGGCGDSQGRFLSPGLECLEFRFGVALPLEQGGASQVAPSGSVTKMTLKDNHLIVVTEERHDISRNARETKMHTDKDGVFVVEVARGIDSSSSKQQQQLLLPSAGGDSNVTGLDATELPFDSKMASNGVHLLNEHSLPPSHEQVQIHAPPQDFAGGHASVAAPLHLIEEAEEQAIEEQALAQVGEAAAEVRACTGLSQSDLSSTSSGDSNKRYSYGNQELYVIEQPGYATSSPTAQPILASPQPHQEQELEQANEETLPEKEPADNPPEAKAEIPSPEKIQEETVEEIQEVAEQEPEIAAIPEATESQPEVDTEPEANYDSLMSLPAPPTTDEINSELGDYTLLESNQLDSLPPPPPPEQQQQQQQHLTKSGAAAAAEEEVEKPIQQAISNGNGLGKVEAEEPATLTPPASPPASPPPQSGIYGGNGLSNGMHSMVDVNGS